MIKIAIIDIIGIPYDGTTVFKQGLGGSESAVTLMARELTDLGFAVTVFNNCEMDHAKPGVYDGIEYMPFRRLAEDFTFDVVISSRTVIPFTDAKDYPRLGDNRCWPFKDMDLYARIVSKAKVRVLWMHDTFCLGDNMIEELAVKDRITDIFTLSDWHLTYIANCHHGRRRNFEVLKRRLFVTRNGVRIYHPEVDIKAKDRDLFVYNASVTKGMIPLVEKIWPHVKRHIPTAKLKVIGGYYRFSVNGQPDEQEKKWREMAADPKLAALDVEFTGVISQREIADILVKANFMLYPAAFPETFGISTLESLCYNTPLITCRFGALEEVALEGACYLIDYAIEPNSLFTDINTADQIEQFVKTTVEAYRNPYLHQQKQYYCNIVKDIAGWDSVAKQWQQHFYKKLGRYLPRKDYQAVAKINRRQHKIWNRRYHNTVELENHKINQERQIFIISPFYNGAGYLEKCIHSVACQDYDTYVHILIDDASTDGGSEKAKNVIAQLPESLRDRFTVITNTERKGAVRNQIEAIRSIDDPEALIMLLDGDDSLVNDNTIFSYFNSIYADGAEFTYGSCWSMVDNIPLISQPYPTDVRRSKTYRQHHFNWIMPYTHLRTFKKRLLDQVGDEMFKDKQGQWYMAGGDGSVFYALIEQADPDRVVCVQDIVYNYNDTNPLNDYKVNGDEQNKNARQIVMMNQDKKIEEPKKKILIAIPASKNIEPETMRSIYDLKIPGGYLTTFQFFYGYSIEQVRNLIAHWVVNGFDYLLSLDTNIKFSPDLLTKMLAANTDIATAIYPKDRGSYRESNIYDQNNLNLSPENLPPGYVEIGSCDLGCALIKRSVLGTLGYPQFKKTDILSGDQSFCVNARSRGFRVITSTDMMAHKIGNFAYSFDVDPKPPRIQSEITPALVPLRTADRVIVT